MAAARTESTSVDLRDIVDQKSPRQTTHSDDLDWTDNVFIFEDLVGRCGSLCRERDDAACAHSPPTSRWVRLCISFSSRSLYLLAWCKVSIQRSRLPHSISLLSRYSTAEGTLSDNYRYQRDPSPYPAKYSCTWSFLKLQSTLPLPRPTALLLRHTPKPSSMRLQTTHVPSS